MGGGGFGGLCLDNRLAFPVAGDHMAGAQLFGIVVRAADGDFARMVETVAERGVARLDAFDLDVDQFFAQDRDDPLQWADRSEEHTSELQSLMRISYAVFCLKKKKNEYNKRRSTA